MEKVSMPDANAGVAQQSVRLPIRHVGVMLARLYCYQFGISIERLDDNPLPP